MNNRGLLIFVASVLILTITVQAQDDPNNTPDPDVVQQLEQIETDVQEIRQLAPQRPVTREALESHEIQQIIQHDVLETYSAESVQRDLAFYVAFGFMEPGVNLMGMTTNLVTGQIVGFYDYDRDRIYLPSVEILSPFNRILYARYYTQLLQNHNFDTDTLLSENLLTHNPDQAMALRALLDGEAQLVTTRYIQQLIEDEPDLIDDLINRAIDTSNPTLDGVPAILKHELLFPTEEGLAFVQSLYEETNSWRLVDLVYQRPPLSTEHILHPTLYLLYEEPHQVELPPIEDGLNEYAGAPEWTLIRTHALGEFYLQAHIGTILAPAQAETAAAGWGGDDFQLYTRDFDNAYVLIWKLSWDTPFDANEFNSIYGSFLGQQLGVSGAIIDNSYSCWIGGERSVCKAMLEDGDILIIVAPSGEMAQHLMTWYIDRSIQIFG